MAGTSFDAYAKTVAPKPTTKWYQQPNATNTGSAGAIYTPAKASTTPKTTTVATTPVQTFAPETSYEPTAPVTPDYGYAVNIDVPNFNWNPTNEQLAGWLQSGGTRANTVIDPQVQAVLQALSRFKTEAQNQQNEINPRYTDMSLALANVIKNQVYQPGVDSLIRRGAADSGALQQLGENSGKYEVEQRAAVEGERNQILNALANQVMGKEQETSDAQTALEKLRGQYTDVYAQENQNTAYNQDFQGKQSKFNADLSVGQLQNQVAAAIANQQYQQAVLAAQQQQSAFENSMSEKEFGLQQSLANYNMRPKGASSPSDPIQDEYNRLRNGILKLELDNPTGSGSNPKTYTSPQGDKYYWNGSQWVYQAL